MDLEEPRHEAARQHPIEDREGFAVHRDLVDEAVKVADPAGVVAVDARVTVARGVNDVDDQPG